MQLNGLSGLLRFLSLLRERKIHFRISQQTDDSLEVAFDMVGVRCEVSFFVDHIEFSTFKGDESVETDPVALLSLVNRFSV